MLTDAQIKHMVDRFLSWKLPEHFNPDCGINFEADAAIKLHPRNRKYEPVGTNLFSATQADAMVRHMLEGLPANAETRPSESEDYVLVPREPTSEMLNAGWCNQPLGPNCSGDLEARYKAMLAAAQP